MVGPATAQAWPAPVAQEPVRGVVTVPASKSVTNRALLLAALADGPSTLGGPLRSRDTELMAAALRAVGAGIVDHGEDWLVTPGSLRGDVDIDVGLAGTVMRFVPPAATLAEGVVRFDGDARARERPMGELLTALRSLGAEIDDGARAALPFAVRGTAGLPGGAVEVDAGASSQIVSALLLSAPRWQDGVRVTHVGDRPVPNAPHLRMTTAMLRRRGVTVDDDTAGRWGVSPGPIAGCSERIEPDLSSAAPFLAAAAVTGGAARVPGWPQHSTQPGVLLPLLLEAFGASTTIEDGTLVVRGGASVHGADLDLRDAGELTPVLAAVAALATSRSRLTGIGYLRGHETDRLAALASELGALGANVVEEDDGLVIEPRPLAGGLFRTYADHRLAMAAAVLGLVVPGLLVEDVETTAKTFPGFAGAWSTYVVGEQR
jgi:3-phosphoshikimate 1-carboxyvinyltransferase